MSRAAGQPVVWMRSCARGSRRNCPTEPPVAANAIARFRRSSGTERATADSTKGKPLAPTATPTSRPAPRWTAKPDAPSAMMTMPKA